MLYMSLSDINDTSLNTITRVPFSLPDSIYEIDMKNIIRNNVDNAVLNIMIPAIFLASVSLILPLRRIEANKML